MKVKTEQRAGWLPDYREGYEAAEKAVQTYGWQTSYNVYRAGKPNGYYGAGFLSGLCDLDPKQGQARSFRGNDRMSFGIR